MDHVLLFVTLTLALMGLVMVFSASAIVAGNRFQDPEFFLKRQIAWLGFGFLLMHLTSRIDYPLWKKLSMPILISMAILLVMVLVPSLGVAAKGARRWLRWGPISIQPAEMVKLVSVIYLATYLAYYLLEQIGSADADVPQQIFLGTLLQSAFLIAASLAGGKLSDQTGRRKIFVFSASILYGLALFVLAIATSLNGVLVGMAISGLGFGLYFAVDLALVLDVLPSKDDAAKDLGVFNMAGAVPFALAPVIAPLILAVGGGSYGSLYAFAGACAITGAFAILRVRRVR